MTKKECAALLFFAALIYPHFALCGDGRANNNFNNFRYYPDSTMFPFYTDPNASYHACNHCGFVHVPLPAYSPPPPMPRQNLPIGVAVQPSNTLPVPDPKKNESLKRPREEAGQDNTSESDKAAKRKKRNEEDTVSDSEEEETAFVGDDSDDGDDGEKEPKIREREYPEIVVLKENELKPNDIFSWAYWWENRRDYGQAKRHYEKAISSSTSREPDARAHFKLAEHHEKGTCRIRKDPREARKHYKLAAEGGCSEAQFKLGLYYEYGQCGFPKNIKRAIFWYEKAAKNSNRSLGALVNLGILNENGIDGKINAKKAAEYYKEAADNGSCDGQYRLSSCFKSGIGVQQDLEEANRLLEQASQNGSAEAANDLGVKYEEEGNYPQAMNHYKLAAERRLPAGLYNLGVCYEEGTITTQDLTEAKRLYQLAKEKGYQPAAEALSELDAEQKN